MKVVYIAGPFRAATRWQVVGNIRRAEQLALQVATIGAMPLCPHTNTANFDGALDDRFLLDGTLELMRRCDAVILVAGWRESAGTKGEIAEANRLQMPVFHDGFAGLRGLATWLKAPGKVSGVHQVLGTLAEGER